MSENSADSFTVDILKRKYQPWAGRIAMYSFYLFAATLFLGSSKYGTTNTIGYKLGLTADCIEYIVFTGLVALCCGLFAGILILVKVQNGYIQFSLTDSIIIIEDENLKQELTGIKKITFNEGIIPYFFDGSTRRGQISIITNDKTYDYDIEYTDHEKSELLEIIKRT